MGGLMRLLDLIKGNDRGVGDTVKRVAEKVGVKPCGGCQQRREQLNQKLPYRKSEEDNK